MIPHISKDFKDSVVSRYYEECKKNETFHEAKVASLREDPPQVSVVTIAYNKKKELPIFLQSLNTQNFFGVVEVIIVDDCSPQKEVELLDPSSYSNLMIKIIRNTENKGNCFSRNLGISHSTSDYIFIVDCDCIPSSNWITEHALKYRFDQCDLVIGVMNVEHPDPLTYLKSWDPIKCILTEISRMQDSTNLHSFLNIVTRNFSVSRRIIKDVNFDETFTYSPDPNSGFGWEDVELGYRLYEKGYKIGFAERCVTVHIPHSAQISDTLKPYRSLKNFRRLLEKHVDFRDVAYTWVTTTFQKIRNWIKECKLPENEDVDAVVKMLQPYKFVSIQLPRTLRILTYRWHTPHQYELYKLPCEFTLVSDMPEGLVNFWGYDHRPFPLHARMLPPHKIRIKDYDLAIVHFDENSIDPHHGFPLGRFWGSTFRFFMEHVPLPKVGICHGTPQFYGQYTDLPFSNIQEITPSKKKLVDLTKDIIVVCNSHQASREWGFQNSTVIWHGFDPVEYPLATYERGVLSLGRPMVERKHYRGYFLYQEVMKYLPQDFKIDSLHVQTPELYSQGTNEFAHEKYWNYRKAVRQYSIYFNPTLRSPMPRTRGEAMMCGVVPVCALNHDVDLFIQNGVNGFYSNDPQELAEYLQYLTSHPDEVRKIGLATRRTALKEFNLHRYHQQWIQLLKEVAS